jgi:hypothetical protein
MAEVTDGSKNKSHRQRTTGKRESKASEWHTHHSRERGHGLG